MDAEQLKKKLSERLGSKISKLERFGSSNIPLITVAKDIVPFVAETLREDEEFRFDWLENFVVVDQRSLLILTYFLRSNFFPENHVVLRTAVEMDDVDAPVKCPRVQKYWHEYSFFEREAAELFGINAGTDSASIPWKGFPMRKTFVMAGGS